jgi:hypothetical protein
MMYILFYIIAFGLCFVALPAGIILGLFTYLHQLGREDQIEYDEKRKKDELDDLMRSRWYEPLDKKFLKIKQYDHIEWLDERINDFEKRYNGVSFFDKSESSYWSDIYYENTKNLLPDIDRYIKICKFLKRKPVNEIIEDWDIFLKQEKENIEYEKRYQLESYERRKEEINDAKLLVIKLLSDGYSRQDVEEKLRENFLNVSVRNGEWTISGTSPWTGGAKVIKVTFRP